jgi:hypothetical protein
MPAIEQLTSNNQIIAIIISHDFLKDGIKLFTPGDFSQPLGYMKHQKLILSAFESQFNNRMVIKGLICESVV